MIIYMYCKTSNNSLHQIFGFLAWKNTKILHVVKMDKRDSPHSSSAKIKMIASAIAEKNIFLDLHLYEHLKLERLIKIIKQIYCFLRTEKVRNTS